MEDLDRTRLELLLMKFFSKDKIKLDDVKIMQSHLEEFADEIIHREIENGNLG